MPLSTRRPLLALAALVLSAVAPATASAARTVVHASYVSPTDAWAPELAVSLDVRKERGEPAALRRVELRLPAAGQLNSARFATCSAAMMNLGGLTSCPRFSRVGFGRFVAEAPGAAGGGTLKGTVVLMNGLGGRSLALLFQAAGPPALEEAFEAPIARVRGRYGWRLAIPFPQSLQVLGPGSRLEIKRLSFSFDEVSADGRSFYALRRCTRRTRETIAASTRFLDGTRAAEAVAGIRCMRRSQDGTVQPLR